MVKKVGHIYSITNIVCTAFIGGGHIIAERNLLQCEMLAPPPLTVNMVKEDKTNILIFIGSLVFVSGLTTLFTSEPRKITTFTSSTYLL